MIRFVAARTSHLTLPIVIGLCLLMLAACGSKGDVKPKLLSLPAAPESVNLQQRGNLLLLSWTMPIHNQDGSAAEDLVGFHIRRDLYPAEESCPTCREPEERVAAIDLDYPAPAQRIGKRFLWRDTEVKQGYGYRYAIVPRTLGRDSGEPAYIHQVLHEAPPAPTGLQAEAGDRQVQLTWQEPALPEGMTLVGYNLYRRQDSNPFPLVPLNSQPIEKTELRDLGLSNGKAYEYRISVLVESKGMKLESFPGQGALITPQAGR